MKKQENKKGGGAIGKAKANNQSGAAALIVGWGQPEDNIHSPNESYSYAQFAKAREWGRRILAAYKSIA